MAFNPQERTRTQTDPRLNRTYESARQLLGQNRFDMKTFADHYTIPVVLDDVRNLAKVQAQINAELTRMTPEARAQNAESKKRALICEAAIFRGVREQKWLGGDAHITKTSEWDDLKNGVDQVVQFLEKDAGSSYLGLAIDVTFSTQLREKFNRIYRDIQNGSLSTIKYFKSVDGSFTGALNNVPRVVVGFDNTRIDKIMRLWNEGDRTSPDESFLHDGVLHEIRMQLEHFSKVAQNAGKEQVMKAYKRDLALIDRVMKLNPPHMSQEQLSEDRVFRSIQENLS